MDEIYFRIGIISHLKITISQISPLNREGVIKTPFNYTFITDLITLLDNNPNTFRVACPEGSSTNFGAHIHWIVAIPF